VIFIILARVAAGVADLVPVVEAITGAGIASDAIAVTIPASTSIFGPGGPEIAEVGVTIDQPQSGAMVELVSAVTAAAQQSGLSVLHVGSRYEAADCVALLQEARDAAIADAKLRAEGLAQALGVTLGELVQAGEYPYFGVRRRHLGPFASLAVSLAGTAPYRRIDSVSRLGARRAAPDASGSRYRSSGQALPVGGWFRSIVS